MGKQLKPYESPLSPDLANEILGLFQVAVEHPGPLPQTIGDMVRRSVETIDRTNERIHQSPVAKIVAQAIMQDLKKRGDASLVVRYDGTVIVRVVYGEEEVETPKTRVRRDAPTVQTTHRSDLPYLDTLRAEAAELGVDITHLGRQRKAIHEYLQAHRRNVKPMVDEVSVRRHDTGSTAVPRAKRGKPTNGAGEADPPSENLGDVLGLPVE